MADLKKEFGERFKELFPGKRLLAVHINGFTNSVIYDGGTAAEKPTVLSYTHYMSHDEQAAYHPEHLAELEKLFDGVEHGPAREIVYVEPKDR